MDGKQIKYAYHKLAESAKTIEQEKEQVRSFDATILAELNEDVDTFRSDYADKISDTLRNMKDIKSEDLAAQLEEYAVALTAAGEAMEKLDNSIADEFS